MKSLVSSFLVPIAFCMACALGGWALGRASTQVRTITLHSGSQVSMQSPVPGSSSGKRSYDAAREVMIIPPHMNSCADPLNPGAGRHLTQI